jgi:hypothetical protein
MKKISTRDLHEKTGEYAEERRAAGGTDNTWIVSEDRDRPVE